MGWRFRKSFKIIPGLRLNLSASGISATIGASPLSLNIGPRGVYGTASLPGTGISFREKLGPLSTTPKPDASPPRPQTPSLATGPVEIRSASTETLNSDSLRQIRDLLAVAYEERSSLLAEIARAQAAATRSAERFEAWNRGFLFKRVFGQAFDRRRQLSQVNAEELAELREQLRLTILAMNIEIERDQAEPYFKMRDAFASLSESQKIWDTLSRAQVNRFVERSSATTAITRAPVHFAIDHCDVIQWEQGVPHLPNRNGGDLFLFPGFVLYRASKQVFALIDSREVRLGFAPYRFHEEEDVPADSSVIGQTWAKCNKDGSPDRRFRNNHQIPVVLYGQLRFTSDTGLEEEFHCSSPTLAESFADSWRTFQASMTTVYDHTTLEET